MAHSENSAVQLYAPRRPRIMHVEFFVKIPTEIYPCMIHAHKMASRVEGTVDVRYYYEYSNTALHAAATERARGPGRSGPDIAVVLRGVCM